MNINLANNPFVVQPGRNELVADPSSPLPAQQQDNHSRVQPVERRNLDQLFTITPQESQKEQSQTQRSESNRLFTLTPRENRQVSNLQSNAANGRRSNNSSISQYLETESLAKREEIESLVRLDIFI